MTPDEMDAELDRLLPKAFRAIDRCLGEKPPRNAQTELAAAKMVLDRKLPATQRTEISGRNGGPLQTKIIVEIVRPLAVSDGEVSRQARIPARTIDAA